MDKAVVYHKVQGFHYTHQETAGHDRGYDRHKDIAYRLDRLLEPVGLLRRDLLDLFLGRLAYPGDLDKLVVHLVDHARAEYDLKLPRREEGPLHPVYVLDRVVVAFFGIGQHDPEPRRAMRRGDQILLPAQQPVYLFRRLFVIHKNSVLSVNYFNI